MRSRIARSLLALFLLGACGDEERSEVAVEAPAPDRQPDPDPGSDPGAEAEAPPHPDALPLAAAALVEHTALRVRADAEIEALLLARRPGRPRVLAIARLGEEASDQLLYVLHATSDMRDLWARAIADGSAEEMRDAIEERIRVCEDNVEDDYEECDSQHDTEQFQDDDVVELLRVEHRLDRALRVTAVEQVQALPGWGQGVFRRIEDSDEDGRPELSIGVRETFGTGQSGTETWTFYWFDGDTLHLQLTFERRSFAYGCSGQVRERSGFSFRDRDGDGRPDVGVRHAVWQDVDGERGWPDLEGCTRLDDAERVRGMALGTPWEFLTDEPRPEDLACPYYDSRVRYLYDADADEWRGPVAVEDG